MTRSRKIWIAAYGLFLLGGLAFVAFRGESTRSTTNEIQKIVVDSPCAEPTSERCSQIRADVARAEPLGNPCITFARVLNHAAFVRYTRCAEHPHREIGSSARKAKEGSHEPTSQAPSVPGGGSGTPSPVDPGSDGGSDGGGPVPDPPSPPSPPQPPGPPDPPDPPDPPSPPPPDSDGGSVLGTGLDPPAVDECGTVILQRLCQ